ncbi:pilus assembly PilX family protein [Marinobacterium lutimaris]|uniref:Type IV pilus assembly protein PilX n=1 Tax=Marinobacterium lutimaris TaxID=568106 RepID=A0A1H6CV23_9GAMM|nr:PilX N-terminal domain-containing pilus assembly protein [Marinobacterium lutimaris]SEG76871.1 type IV pilus assembly protein PilX [Marinobacterium lutimaris]
MNAQGFRNESGAALIVALIMLLLITIVGVSAMQTTTMEEKMAGNLRDRHVAFQAAEAALRQGESDAEDSFPNVDGESDTITVNINGNDVNASYTLTEQSVEYQPSLDANESPDYTVMIVRVVARSRGLSGSADVQLESTYRIER